MMKIILSCIRENDQFYLLLKNNKRKLKIFRRDAYAEYPYMHPCGVSIYHSSFFKISREISNDVRSQAMQWNHFEIASTNSSDMVI